MANDLSVVPDLKPRRIAAVLEVSAVRRLTTNMIRITLAGPNLSVVPSDAAGGHCKLMPQPRGNPTRRSSGADQMP